MLREEHIKSMYNIQKAQCHIKISVKILLIVVALKAKGTISISIHWRLREEIVYNQT